jgi:Kef-type K+ transport system membrane component KefB
MSVEEVGGFPVERFLLALALVLVVSKLFGGMAERIKQPAVLGELFTGVMLGASVLAIVPSVPGQAGYETFHLLAEIGVGMIPRDEVGLIFAQMGLTSGVFDSRLFSAITVMVMLTTFIAPPLLKITFAEGEPALEAEAKS